MPSQVLSLRPELADSPADARQHLEALALAPGDIVLDDAQCLALLCGGDPDAAAAVLATFGSLPEVLGAAAGDLVRVAGRPGAVRLRLVRELARRMLIRPLRARPVLSGSQAVSDYLRTTFTGAPREQFRVLFLDRRHHLIALHLAVRALGDDGRRLNPKKADLAAWREGFARALRDRGVEAEATPRRARGVTRKPERAPVRKIGERHAAGRGPMAEVRRGAYRDAAGAAFQGGTAPTPWEAQMLRRQAQVRALYLAQAGLLKASADAADRALGLAVESFVRDMPAPDTQRLALARELREANRAFAPERSDEGGGRERSR
jgi:hypothetical protein